MGAFDHLSDDDPRVISHEYGKTHNNCGLSSYTIEELEIEINERKVQIVKNKAEKDKRYKAYLKLKEEFGDK